MKRALSILEVFFLILITTFNGLRFDGKNSQPYYLDNEPLEWTLFLLLVLVVILRAIALWKQNFKMTVVNSRQSYFLLGLYFIAISKDLYHFSIWAIYAGYHGEFLLVLLLPVFVGLINHLIKNITSSRRHTNPKPHRG